MGAFIGDTLYLYKEILYVKKNWIEDFRYIQGPIIHGEFSARAEFQPG